MIKLLIKLIPRSSPQNSSENFKSKTKRPIDKRRQQIIDDLRFRTTKLTSSFCDCSDAYILVNGRITITGTGDNELARQVDKINEK